MEQFTVQLNNATCTVCIGAGVLGRAGAPQHTGADTHRAGRVVQLDGKLFHRLPPQPAGHCTQQSDSRLAIKSLSIDGNINT